MFVRCLYKCTLLTTSWAGGFARKGYTYSKDEKTLFTFIAYLNDDFVDDGDGDGGGIDTGL